MIEPGQVWMSTLRRRLAYHGVMARSTLCGQFVGNVDQDQQIRGHLLDKAKAVEQYGAKPCARCYGMAEVKKPNVVPTKGAR